MLITGEKLKVQTRIDNNSTQAIFQSVTVNTHRCFVIVNARSGKKTPCVYFYRHKSFF